MLNCAAFICDTLVLPVEWGILLKEKFLNGFGVIEKGRVFEILAKKALTENISPN